MKTWKKILIVALCVLAVTAAVFVGMLVNIRYERYYKTCYWESLARHVSPNILMEYGREKGHEFVRLKNVKTGKTTTPKLQHIFINENYTKDSLVVFRTFDRLRGYLNVNTGQIIIPAQYNRAWNFSEGMAAVLKDGVVAFINADGGLAFDRTFPIYYDDDYSDIAFQFHEGVCVMRTLDNKWGLIDQQGEWIAEPIYTTIYAPQNGYRIVRNGNKYGMITIGGKIALPLEYDIIRLASDKRGFILAKDGIAKEVDMNLNTIVPFVYDGLYRLDYAPKYNDSYDEETCGDAYKYWRYDIGSGSGVMDRDGNVIIPAKYYMVRIVNDHLFEAEVTCDGDCILFNNKGQVVGKSDF